MNNDKYIIAGIVTFNPNVERLKNNIETIINQVEKLVIFDNGSENIEKLSELLKVYDTNKIFLYTNNNNLGIAKALNNIMEIAKNEGFLWVLTMDQDSIIPNGMINKFKDYISDEVGIICPMIIDINRTDIKKVKEEFTEITRCISSGSLTNVKIWEKIGGFDEFMFIDGVDFDYCDRLIFNSYKIIRVNEIKMLHEIGHINEKKIFGIKIIVRNHSAFRKYYIARNILYLDKKNKVKFFSYKSILRIIKLILITLIYEENKKEKIFAILSGIKDGFFVKIGEPRC